MELPHNEHDPKSLGGRRTKLTDKLADVKCPHCHKTIPARLIRKEGARALAANRTNAGRRPDTTVERCPCGRMTLKRAETRGREGGGKHLPSCPFHLPTA